MTCSLIYILGDVRSGSTLLDMLLGQHPNLASTGELHSFGAFWNNRYKRKSTCTCKNHINDCPFWKPIANELESHHIDLTDFKTRATPTLRDALSYRFKYLLSRASKESIAVENSFLIIDAIKKVHNISWCIDSSKTPHRALAYKKMAAKERHIRLIFLLRHPVANTYSKATRGSVSLLRAALSWNRVAIIDLITFLRYARNAKCFLRYEDLCSKPDSCIQSVYRWLGLPHIPISKPRITHNLGGSSGKQEPDKFTIVTDDRYRHELSLFQRSWIFALTAPVYWIVSVLSRSSKLTEDRDHSSC